MIDDAQLRAAVSAVAPHFPGNIVLIWTDALSAPMRSCGMVTPNRVAAALGQFSEESSGFAVLQENLRYSAQRLCEVWPGRFPTLAAAAPYADNPEALANLVYAGRMGNGDAASGDGWRFRGEGLIELTGRELDTKFAAAFGKPLDDAMAWLLTPVGAATSACWYWSQHNLNHLADVWDITGITRLVNGGLTNLQTRLKLSNLALAAIGGPPSAPATASQPPPPASGQGKVDALNDNELAQLNSAA
jgi:putative chitinase